MGKSKFISSDDINVFKVGYTYDAGAEHTGEKSGEHHNYTVGPFNFSVEQGQIVCIKSAPGAHSHGKKTLLSLLGGPNQLTD